MLPASGEAFIVRNQASVVSLFTAQRSAEKSHSSAMKNIPAIKSARDSAGMTIP
jgi:hypothetical protein